MSKLCGRILGKPGLPPGLNASEDVDTAHVPTTYAEDRMSARVVERLHGIGKLWWLGRLQHQAFYQLAVFDEAGRTDAKDGEPVADGTERAMPFPAVQGTLTLRAANWTLPPGVCATEEPLALQLLDGRTILLYEITGGTTQRFVRGAFEEKSVTGEDPAAGGVDEVNSRLLV